MKNTTREEPIKDDKGRYHVAYVATVRITHRRSGVFREDCGAGDAIDRSLASASGNALKGAVTDAMKRAARHFGEKLGNSLYHDGFNANNAPPTLKDALDTLDIDRAKSRFGFDKDRKVAAAAQNAAAAQPKQALNHSNQKVVAPTNAALAKTAQQTPRTQYVGNITTMNTKPHVTPHHGGAGGNNNAARSANVAASSNQNTAKPTTYVTPGNRAATTSNKTTFDPSAFAAVPAEKLRSNAKAKENADPQNNNPPSTGGLALPPRPGTSRGAPPADNPSTTAAAYEQHFPASNDTPSMFGANGTMSQALTVEQHQSQSIAQSLKRKNESLDAATAAKSANTGAMSQARNPYNC